MIKICIPLLMWSLLLSSANAEVTIVASIKPLALISTAILGERGTVLTLVDAQQSPHDYAMKPSDRIAIQRADILVWVSPVFEVYLADVFPEKSAQKTLITFSELNNIELFREVTGELDPHVWLDSGNAFVLATEIATQASIIDVANADYFQENLDKFAAKLSLAEASIATMFAGDNRKSYAVYHNAYRYFEEQFGLDHALVLMKNPELQPNVQEIIRVRNNVQESQPNCLLVESDSNPAIINTMLGGYQLSQPIVDVLGNTLPANAAGYVSLLTTLANQFKECIY